MPCKDTEAKFNKVCSDVTAKDIADLGLCEAAEQLAITNASTNCLGQGYKSCELQTRKRNITDGSMNDSHTFQTTVGCTSNVTLRGY